jgi:hypothetical protein
MKLLKRWVPGNPAAQLLHFSLPPETGKAMRKISYVFSQDVRRGLSEKRD